MSNIGEGFAKLLIAPEGIEIVPDLYVYILFPLLIAPEGIEISRLVPSGSLETILLLIAPEGIEIMNKFFVTTSRGWFS